MTLMKSLADLDTNGHKGDWALLNDDSLIALLYGDDHFKDLVILPIALQAMPGKPHWQWDGNREEPTLTPSILVHAYPGWTNGWHGWLTAGKLVTA